MTNDALLSTRLALCLLLPAVLLLVCLFGLPLMWAFWGSLGLNETQRGWGFDAWFDVLLDPIKRQGLWMSLYYSVLPVLLAAPVALPLAALLQQRLIARPLFMALFRLPIATPGVVVAFVFMVLWDQGGFVFRVLGADTPRLVRDDWGMGVVLATAARELPFMTLLIAVSLASIPRELLLAARSLGASPWRVVWHVQMPLAWPGVSAAMALSFVKLIGSYAIPQLIGPIFPLPLSVLMVDAYQQGRWVEACAMGMVLSLFAVGLLVVYQALTRRLASDRWEVLS